VEFARQYKKKTETEEEGLKEEERRRNGIKDRTLF
jgi:hypothetical protein